MNKIDWKEMSIEKTSMLGLINGKYIQSEDNYKYPFMLCMGRDRHFNMKLFLIECIENNFKVYLCKDEKEADDTAFNIIVYLLRNGKVTDFLQEKSHSE